MFNFRKMMSFLLVFIMLFSINIEATNEDIKHTQTLTEIYEDSVTITIVDEDWNIIPNVKLNIRDENLHIVSSGNTEEDGMFVVENLSAGKYIVDAYGVPEGYYPPEDKEFIIELIKKNVEWTADVVFDDIHVFVAAANTNMGIDNVEITVYDKNKNIVRNGKTDEFGLLKMLDFEPNDYIVCISSISDEYKKPEAQEVTIEVQPTYTETEVVVNGNRVTVIVKDILTGTLIANAKVNIRPEFIVPIVDSGITNENGEVTFTNLENGKYLVDVYIVPDEYYPPEDVEFEIKESKKEQKVISIEKTKTEEITDKKTEKIQKPSADTKITTKSIKHNEISFISEQQPRLHFVYSNSRILLSTFRQQLVFISKY